jgi:hypothetical protein
MQATPQRGDAAAQTRQLLINRSSTNKTMAPTVEVTMAFTHQKPPTGGR